MQSGPLSHISGTEYESDFSYDQPASDGALKPLSTNFYKNLLLLEEKIQMRRFTMDTINNLVTLYAKCVEYYDGVRDPIQFYFMEKIQITLANSETLKIIVNSKEKVRRKKSLNKQNINYDDNYNSDSETTSSKTGSEEDTRGDKNIAKEAVGKFYGENEVSIDISAADMVEPISEDILANYVPKNRSSDIIHNSVKSRDKYQRYSISRKKIERSKKWTIYKELQEKKNTAEISDVSGILNEYKDKVNMMEELVKKNLRDQEEAIKKRLTERKNLKALKLSKKNSSISSQSRRISLSEKKSPRKFSQFSSEQAQSKEFKLDNILSNKVDQKQHRFSQNIPNALRRDERFGPIEKDRSATISSFRNPNQTSPSLNKVEDNSQRGSSNKPSPDAKSKTPLVIPKLISSSSSVSDSSSDSESSEPNAKA